MAMERREYRVTFLTPAFLGDAEQKGRWRTPPFKALLRQWWRVVKANELLRGGCQPQRLHTEVREAEGRLFGHAWLTDGGKTWAMRSRVRLRLGGWRDGTLDRWETDPRVTHPEVTNRQGEAMPVGAHLYLGYGPLTYSRELRSTALKGTDERHPKPAIGAGDQNILVLGFPDDFAAELERTVELIHWFGTVGGRSRNGWGSFVLDGDGLQATEMLTQSVGFPLAAVTRDFASCLALEWSHALGADEHGPLVWRTEEVGTWPNAMQRLAEVKIKFRTAIPIAPNGQFGERHVLAYPVTHHPTAWGGQKRLANQMRFKVVRSGDAYFGIVFHLPCAIPRDFHRPGVPDGQGQLTVWRKVHGVLDSTLVRLSGAGR
jgi:CRISPR-associated protein Cmr1